jgi:hypothetical protein
MNPPLLITSAIFPPLGVPYLGLTNPIKRKLVAKAALIFWITKGARQIVVADATGATLLSDEEVAEMQSLKVDVEQISYAQDSARLAERGKGYGEGRLIEFAMENSRILGGNANFYKSTSKTFVRNFVDICKIIEQNPIDCLFWKKVDPQHQLMQHIDCRFYLTSKDYARHHLIPAYLLADDRVNAPCEQFIYAELTRSAKAAFAPRPLVHGVAGLDDQDYFDQSLGALDTGAPCWVVAR